MSKLSVQKSKFGRGVFATKSIKEGEVVEVCPVILVPNGKIHTSPSYPGRKCSFRDSKSEINLQLSRYTFGWSMSLKALALGFGSLYNHSFEPNIRPKPSYKEEVISFIALRNIKKGEELFFNYQYDPSRYDELEQVAKDISEMNLFERDHAQKLFDSGEKRTLEIYEEQKKRKKAS